jgi:hypothetical protein
MSHRIRRPETRRHADQASAMTEAVQEALDRSRAAVEESLDLLRVHEAPRSVADLFVPSQDSGPMREG